MILKTSNQILSQAKASLTSIDVVASAIIGFALGMVFSVGRSFYGSLGLMSFKDSWLWIRGFCYGCAAGGRKLQLRRRRNPRSRARVARPKSR